MNFTRGSRSYGDGLDSGRGREGLAHEFNRGGNPSAHRRSELVKPQLVVNLRQELAHLHIP
jgi:hypothetical protein